MPRTYVNCTTLAKLVVRDDRTVLLYPGYGCGQVQAEITRDEAATCLSDARRLRHDVYRMRPRTKRVATDTTTDTPKDGEIAA